MEFCDLKYQYNLYKEELREEMEKVLSSAAFINGPSVREFEEALASFCGIPHVIGCSNGTEALFIAMLALGVKPGDEVIVPDFTFIATAETVALLGAKPVFADILPDTLNIDPEDVRRRITPKTVGIIPVSLYGQCADMDEINIIAGERGLWVMEDAAQSCGALYKGRFSGNLSTAATTSFFPAKPLGCYGDGGAIFVQEAGLAEKIRKIVNHGQEVRYRHGMVGTNGRLDSLQAAVLLVKLRHFKEELELRNLAAARYTELLSTSVPVPKVLPHNRSVWAQYTVRVSSRDNVIAALKEKGIPTAVHYPVPLHDQKAFAYLGDTEPRPVTEKASREVLSLPMHPFLSVEDQTRVTEALKAAVSNKGK